MSVTMKALAEVVKGVDASRRTVTHWITKEVVDRDSELVKVEGVNSSEFMANPVVLWMHDRKMPPIGKCGNGSLIKVIGEGIEATTEFATTPFASDVFDLYKGGFLTSWSMGFSVTDAAGPELDGQKGMTIKACDLREYSAVTVPANPAALVKAAEEGSDLAGRLLQLYHPTEKDAVGAARVACDMRRVLTGLESLTNWQRHCKAEGLEFDAEPLAKATEFLTALGIVPAPPATPQTHAGATDGDLPDEAVKGLLSLMRELREHITQPGQVAIAKREAERLARQRLIGKR